MGHRPPIRPLKPVREWADTFKRSRDHTGDVGVGWVYAATEFVPEIPVQRIRYRRVVERTSRLPKRGAGI